MCLRQCIGCPPNYELFTGHGNLNSEKMECAHTVWFYKVSVHPFSPFHVFIGCLYFQTPGNLSAEIPVSKNIDIVTC